MGNAVKCLHRNREMMLGAKGKGIAQWCADCGAHNPGEGCDWRVPANAKSIRRHVKSMEDLLARAGVKIVNQTRELRLSQERIREMQATGADNCKQSQCEHLEMGSVGDDRYCRNCNLSERDMRASQEIRHQLDMAYERIEDLEKRLLKERVEHGETFLRAKKSDDMLREIKLAMPHVEAGYDDYDAKVKKSEAQLEECGDKIGRQAEKIEYYRRERDRHREERHAAVAELNKLGQSDDGDVHTMKDMEADLRNYRAKEAHYLELIGSVWSVLNGYSDAHKKHDAS